MADIIDGKQLADQITNNVRQQLKQNPIQVGLSVVLVGNDPASEIYVDLKQKACHKVGIDFNLYKLDADSSAEHIKEVINFLNNDQHTHAILVQLPLPDHLERDDIISTIDPQKDVDGFHPQNVEAFLNRESSFVPGLIEGIDYLIQQAVDDLDNKKICILANSQRFADMSHKYFSNKGAQVVTTFPTQDWDTHTSQADILVVAIGKPQHIKASDVKKDAVVIDVGVNRLTKNTVVGDVDFDDVEEKVTAITPVPGGVGPITIAMLLNNTLKLAVK